MSDMPSSGGAVKATSFEMSPTVAFVVELAELLLKSPDMLFGVGQVVYPGSFIAKLNMYIYGIWWLKSTLSLLTH